MITPNPQKKLLPLPDALPVQTLAGFWDEKDIRLQVLRLDSLHPVVSGNKWFKLQHWLRFHQENGHRSLVTFGGAWSNHLVATAFACHELDIPCTGIIRGEAPLNYSATLLQCKAYGMQLQFISRTEYAAKEHPAFLASLQAAYGPATLVPEGGFSPEGASGAADICRFISGEHTHICCAAGTGTTAAGLLLGKQNHQQVLAFPVLKGLYDLPQRVRQLIKQEHMSPALHIIDGYHGGGYARCNEVLLESMNGLYENYTLPTDFVYTAKMMTGVFDLLQKNYFPAGSRILCIHSGGLQGNRSLPAGSLIF